MSALEEITKLDRSIKDADIRIHTWQINIDALNKEIDILTRTEKLLDENIACLKEKGIVAIATEYKKAKEELARVQHRMTNLTNDRALFVKHIEDFRKFISKTQKELDKLQVKSDNNVLQFRGKKDGQG